jgi:hypothetical protein
MHNAEMAAPDIRAAIQGLCSAQSGHLALAKTFRYWF